MGKYKFNKDAYERRLAREKNRPDLHERFKVYEDLIKQQPVFDDEGEAVKHAVSGIEKDQNWKVFKAPDELGGKWHAVHCKGIEAEAADQLGLCLMYDYEDLVETIRENIDDIEEV